MFSVSEYFDRLEKASLEILENRRPIDKTITLWWGFDGIRLSEDGTCKWVSRKKKTVENVFYQPCQSIQWSMPFESGTLRYGFTSQIQSTRARIEELQRFAAEYLVYLNATAAAKRAGYSEKTACEQAVRLLANFKVQTAVQEAEQARQGRK